MRTRPFLFIAAALTAALFFLIYPLYVIRPFRYQGPRELAAALAMVQYRPLIETICVLLVLLCSVLAWPSASSRRRVLLVTSLFFAAVSGLLCRVNVYEKMFHPLDAPQFSSVDQTKLDPHEKVIAVLVQGNARAYTIRGMSYHHIVNDTLGGRAIVATY